MAVSRRREYHGGGCGPAEQTRRIDSEGVDVNQALLQLMANERILDAGALRATGRWAYAYYVAGYAVECALKSCVLAQMIYTGGVFTSLCLV